METRSFNDLYVLTKAQSILICISARNQTSMFF